MVRRITALCAVVTLMLIVVAGRDSASAEVAWRAKGCAEHAPEAAVRSGIATTIILRVMLAESGGDPQARSSKGAMGCMQIMPATLRYLAPRYGLGPVPLDARMNMIGGALYLAELARRFGWPGAFAAYNAGPSRYLRYATRGVPLPAETAGYVARLDGAAALAIAPNSVVRWQGARLFIGSLGDRPKGVGRRDIRLETALAADTEKAASAFTMPVTRPAPTLFPLAAAATRADR